MRQFVIAATLGAAVLVTGCATKTYVRGTVQPVQTKVDQVADQTNKQGTELDQTRKDVDKNTTQISAVGETAAGADRRAGDAMTKANQVDGRVDQTNRDLGSLRQTIANLDDYKVVNQATVLFAFNAAKLTADDKQQLDQLISGTTSLKRYFIAVEGYTDQTGSADYNLELSKRRADAVVQYLSGQHDVDFNRVHTIGFGEQKPTDTGKSRDSRAKNRRVEVKVYSADAALAAVTSSR
jgi:OOP family OmpA-OmpF porin